MDSCCFDSGCPLLMNLEHPINFVDEWISNWLTKLGLIPHTHTHKQKHARTHTQVENPAAFLILQSIESTEFTGDEPTNRQLQQLQQQQQQQRARKEEEEAEERQPRTGDRRRQLPSRTLRHGEHKRLAPPSSLPARRESLPGIISADSCDAVIGRKILFATNIARIVERIFDRVMRGRVALDSCGSSTGDSVEESLLPRGRGESRETSRAPRILRSVAFYWTLTGLERSISASRSHWWQMTKNMNGANDKNILKRTLLKKTLISFAQNFKWFPCSCPARSASEGERKANPL